MKNTAKSSMLKDNHLFLGSDYCIITWRYVEAEYVMCEHTSTVPLEGAVASTVDHICG